MAAYPFSRILSAVILSAGVFGLAGCASHPIPHAAGTSGRQALAFPSLHLADGEYIQSVQIVVKEGRIASVNRLLDDWDIELVWDHPALLTLTYQARHFSAGLDDLHRLDGFIIVEATDDQRFSIAATVKTESTDNTGRGERTYSFSTPDLVLKPPFAGAGCAAENPKPVQKIVQPDYRK